MRLIFAALLAWVFWASPAAADSLEMTQANIHFNLALKQYQAQKLDDAKITLAKALALVPDHPQANYLTGLIACQQSRFEDALVPLKTASVGLAGNPDVLADVLTNLGVAYFQLNRLPEAEDALKRAAQMKPDRGDISMNLGLVELRQKQFPEAQKYFAAAAAADKGQAQAWLGLAESADGSGDTGAALQAREQALALQPQDQSLRLELGEALYQAQRITEAASVTQPLQGLGDASAEFLLGVLDYRQGQFDSSRERFQAALTIRPDYPEARYNLAITFYDQGLYAEALKQFQTVLDKHPGDEDARRNLDITRQAAVRSWLKEGSQDFLKSDYMAALARWKAALALDTGNKVVKDLVDTAESQLKLQAQDLADKGQKDWGASNKEDAISEWSQALERDPSNATAKQGMDGAKSEIQKMADAFKQAAADDVAQGRWEMARAAVDKVAHLDRSQGQALSQTVESAAKAQYDAALASAQDALAKGQLSQRVDDLERAVEAAPQDASAQLMLNQAKVAYRQALNDALTAADAAEKAAKQEDAVKQYQRALDLQASNAQAKDALKRLGAKASSKGADPSELEDLYYQGVYAYAAGDSAKAEALWKRVLLEDPRHVLAKEALERSRRNRQAADQN